MKESNHNVADVCIIVFGYRNWRAVGYHGRQGSAADVRRHGAPLEGHRVVAQGARRCSDGRNESCYERPTVRSAAR